MKDKEKHLTAVIEKVLRDTQNCDMSIETLTDYLVDRIKNKDLPEDSVVLSKEKYREFLEMKRDMINNTQYKRGSKETAEKIYREITELSENPCNSREEIYEKVFGKYGVEIKE